MSQRKKQSQPRRERVLQEKAPEPAEMAVSAEKSNILVAEPAKKAVSTPP
ncbi:hypothetical protein HQN90_10420 [Paenibacillus alba]|nr:hypothetical protein [Paenibacillus alba]